MPDRSASESTWASLRAASATSTGVPAGGFFSPRNSGSSADRHASTAGTIGQGGPDGGAGGGGAAAPGAPADASNRLSSAPPLPTRCCLGGAGLGRGLAGSRGRLANPGGGPVTGAARSAGRAGAGG